MIFVSVKFGIKWLKFDFESINDFKAILVLLLNVEIKHRFSTKNTYWILFFVLLSTSIKFKAKTST